MYLTSSIDYKIPYTKVVKFEQQIDQENYKDEDGNWIPGQYEAKEDGSLNAFYIYDENNTILVNEDNERFD